MQKKVLILITMFLFISVSAEIVIEDEGITLTKQELELIVQGWPADIQSDAAEDEGVRESFLGQLMINKKIANELDKIKEKDDAALYWKTQWMIITEKTKIYSSDVMRKTKLPNVDELAKEIYKVDKKDNAFSPEKRSSSHILLQCVPDKGCNLEDRLEEAKKIIEELERGASFEDLVEKNTEDFGTKTKKGSLGASVTINQINIDPDYRKALFSLKKKGDVSEVIKSQFGFHIIRLDEIEEERILSFDEVKPNLVKSIEAKYREAEVKSFKSQFWFTEKTEVNKEVLDEIFSKYKKKPEK